MQTDIKPGIYRHFKGGHVLVLFCAKHSDREEIEVVYKGLNNGKYYARPIESFCDIVEGENGKTPRFIYDPDAIKTFENAEEIKDVLKIFDR